MFWYGVFGFVALFIHGINSVSHYSDRMEMLRMVGGGLVGLSLLEYMPGKERALLPWMASVFGVLAAVFAVLILYTNVIAWNPGAWKRAAKREKEPDKETLVDTGLFALCRHPGLWWMAGLCVCLYLSGGMPWMTMLLYIALYGAVTFYYDSEVYPETIPGYKNYKKRTNFLFPDAAGFARCFGKKDRSKGK